MMDPFGPYEIVREVASGPTVTVYSARKQGEKAATDYALKLFSLDPVFGGDHETKSDLDPLLLELATTFNSRTDVQKKAAASSPYVAPIFDVGRDYRGAWSATRLYPRSVQKIIAGRVTLSPQDFFHVIHSIVLGTLDFKRICGRPHGNLKTTNVFIGGQGKLKDDDIVLSDPLPGEPAESVRYELADLRAIGQIIYQLVRRREVTNEADWAIVPILTSSEWSELFGKDAAAWLAICNRLLDPQLSLEICSLERLAADLGKLKPKPPVSTPFLVAMGGLAVLGIVGVLLAYVLTNKGTLYLSSDPPGAKITVGQQPAGTTAAGSFLEFKIRSGEVEVEAELAGWPKQTRRVQSARGKPSTNVFEFPYGAFTVISDPDKAEFKVNGRDLLTPVTMNFVPTGQIAFQLRRTNYEPTNVTFVVQARRTNVITVTMNDMDPRKGQVDVDSDPRNAEFVVDGRTYKTPTLVSMRAGTNELTVRYRDWPTKTERFVVVARQRTNVSVKFDYGTVQFDTDPQGARVLVDKAPLGVTPARVPWKPGSSSFDLIADAFEPTNVTVNVVAGQTVTVLTKLVTTNAILELSSEPAPAVIFDANRRRIMETRPNELSRTQAPPGNITLIAQYPGLADVTKTVRADRGKQVPVNFVFEYGKATINSIPPNAVVQSGTQTLGPTPVTVIQKPNEFVTYRLTAPDYDPLTTNVTVKNKESGSLTVSLLPERVSVALESDPPGAQFYNPAESPQTPLVLQQSITALRWGTNTITARHPLFELEPVSATFLVRKSQANRQTFQFTYGLLVVTSQPPGATVKLGGNPLGDKTPSTNLLKPGAYQLELAYGGRLTNVSATVTANRGLVVVGATFPRLNYTNSLGMEFAQLPGGIWIGQFEVTQDHYQQVMGENPSAVARPKLPVNQVNWNKAMEFCRKLTESDQAALQAGQLAGHVYTLPTAAEWKLATPDAASLVEAVLNASEPKDITPERKSFNEQRIYDLLGNVAEWTADKTTIGGAYNRLRPKQVPADSYAGTATEQMITADGARNTGLRVILKKP